MKIEYSEIAIKDLLGFNKETFRFVVARKIRVIFQIKNDELIILILRVGKRKDIYD